MHKPVPVSSLNLPASHCVHSPAPGASLYVPAWHAVHGPPCGPEKPVLHTQSLTESLPSSAVNPANPHHFGSSLNFPLPFFENLKERGRRDADPPDSGGADNGRGGGDAGQRYRPPFSPWFVAACI